MNAPLLPGATLTPEQRRLLNQLTDRIEADQARWLSGYFAGLAAGVAKEVEEVADAPARRGLLILYGSETGNSAALACTLRGALQERGLTPALADMGDYKTRNLAQENDILILVSTYGEGDPPQPAVGFFDFVEGRRAPKLPQSRFAVLGLGDSSYERFCEAGKRLDARFEALGATRLLPRVDCDIDYDDPAAEWIAHLVDVLAAEATGPAQSKAKAAVKEAAAASYDKRTPFSARITENIVIVGRGSSKETRHVEISLEGSGLTYEPGDAIGFSPANAPEVVESLLSALGADAAAPVELKKNTTTLGTAFADKLEITTATPRFLEFWAERSGAQALKHLLGKGHAGERAAFLKGHHIVDIVRQFPVPGVPPQDFIGSLRPQQPRLYSLASSLSYAPEEAHITIAPVLYNLHGELRAGVATDQLRLSGEPDSILPVYIQSNPHFRLPADDMPAIMIGAGTGVAPYRAFLQEREARGAGGRAWLFFGERRFRTDFLYQTEWQSFLKDGLLTRMDVAFSRDGPSKVYVQDRMREQARDLYAWLEEGAHIYVCGDAANMAPDVHTALLDVISDMGHISREAAADYVRGLAADHRYQRDVY